MPRANRAKVNQAMSNAVASRPKLPPLPDVRELTSMLLDYSRALEPGESFETWLYCEGYSWPDAHWVLGCDQGRWDLSSSNIYQDGWPHAAHHEMVPGGGVRFDAVAAARRLLAEARLAGFR